MARICYTATAVDEILTVSEAASFLRKHPGTVRMWIRNGRLKAKKVSAGGRGVYVLLKTDILEHVVSAAMEKKIPRQVRKKPEKPSPQVRLPL